MTRLLSFALWLAIAASVAAIQKAPLPERLATAVKVYLVNDSGDLKAFDKFFEELSNWGRFAIVTTREQADVVVVLTSSAQYAYSISTATATAVGGVAQGTGMSIPVTSSFLHLKIFDRQTADVLWSDQTEKWITSAAHAPSILVSRLKDRMPPPRTAPASADGLLPNGLPSLFDAIPATKIASVQNGVVTVDLKGCFGAYGAQEVIVCACDVWAKSVDNRQVNIALWGATLAAVPGTEVAKADSVSDLQRVFTFSGAEPAVGSVNGASSTRLYFRFQFPTKRAGGVDVGLAVEVGANGLLGRTSFKFSAISIIRIDPTKDAQVKAFFTR
jgi:hypothetical protein